MDLSHLAFVFFVFLICNSSSIESQQPYIGAATTRCDTAPDNSTSEMGYFCNGATPSCQAYLTFRSLPPYNSVSSISTLLDVDPSQLSLLNSVSQDAIFPTNKVVLVPVNCSCSGSYYQHNTSYVVQSGNSYFSIANGTYEGLSSCQALQSQNANQSSTSLSVGTRISVPLRCACPTKNQTDTGVKYLLSYLVRSGQDVSTISSMLGASTDQTLDANGLSLQDPSIFPFTTLLVPLQAVPSSSSILDTAPEPSQQTPPVTIAPSPKSSSSKTWIYAVVGTLGGISLLLVSALLVYCFCFHKRKREKNSVVVSQSFESVEKPVAKKMNEDLSSESFWDSISSIAAQSLTVYTYEELKLATDNFSPSCLLGGSVYRGTLKGDFAAIKKVTGDVSEEINLLNKINHLNLIRLSGVGFSDGYWYLVFEYAANGSLSSWIYRKNSSEEEKFLNWMQRIQIAFDVASGLNYLHSYTSPPHVHKDLKCSNVLLDGEYRAKITNFGLARSTDATQGGGQFAMTRHIIGTKGYMAPEYLENGLVSPKLDVYSFGVLLLEILSGKEVGLNNLGESLASVLDEKNGNQRVKDFMDPSLGGDYPLELAVMVMKLSESCMKKDPSARPNMHEIVQILSATMSATTSWESKLDV